MQILYQDNLDCDLGPALYLRVSFSLTFTGWVKAQRSHSYYYYNRYNNRNRWSGELKSRNFSPGRQYPNQLYQYWKLTSNTRIGIYFKVFSTELCCDKVRIYDGSSPSSPLIGDFSGNTLPPNITSSSNQLYVTFTTDDSKPGTGFLATYRCKYQFRYHGIHKLLQLIMEE